MFKKCLSVLVMLLVCVMGITVFASDWKQCKTEVVIANPLDSKCIYTVYWIDHDIAKYIDRPVNRCGGEIKSYSFEPLSKNFRLCLGRHVVIWYKLDSRNMKLYNRYMFVITESMDQIILTPEGIKFK